MPSATSEPNPFWRQEDIVVLAEVLGNIIVERVNNTVRQTIASEAKTWRIDALRLRTDLRPDIGSHFLDADGGHSERSPTSRVHLSQPMSPIVSEYSSQGSSDTLPITTFRRTTSLEQRLAADIFAAKFGERGPKHSKAQTRKDRAPSRVMPFTTQPSASSHEAPPDPHPPFCALVPSPPAPIESLPGQLKVDELEVCPTSQQDQSTLSMPDRLVAAPSSSPDIREQINSQSIGLNVSDSRTPHVSDRVEAMVEVGIGSQGYALHSHTSSDPSRGGRRWKNQAIQFYHNKSIAEPVERWPARKISLIVFRALGLVPWSVEFRALSRIYQFACLCCLMLSALSVVIDAASYKWEGPDFYASALDEVLIFGASLSFSAALWKNEALTDASWLIDAYLSRAGMLGAANKKSCLDVAILSGVWVLCVGFRLYGGAGFYLGDVGFAFNILVLLAICAYALRVCRCLLSMVHHFCFSMQDTTDFEELLEEFFLLHCTVRTACTSLQWCFVVLVLTATLVFLFCSASIYLNPMTVDWATVSLIPAMLCEVVLLYLALCAGLVSDLCARVPMLVNSVNADLEMKRMYVVEYIVHCQTGFYVFELRLGTATLLKIFYVAFVAWCSVLTEGLISSRVGEV